MTNINKEDIEKIAGILGVPLGSTTSNLLSGGLSSGAGNAISGIGSTIGGAVGTANPLLGAGISIGSNILGGITNSLFGSKLNQANIDKIQSNNNTLNSMQYTGDNDSLSNQWANTNFGENFSKSDIGKDGLFSSKTKHKYNELKFQQDIARNRALNAFKNAANAADFNNNYNATLNFAAYGGQLFSNGQTEINNGGSHESNPLGGVPFGIGINGKPNSVEEGEVVYNNYVFSDRLITNKNILKQANLPESFAGYSFAKIADKLGKESKERPNDPISKKGLEDSMNKLQMAQEAMKAKKYNKDTTQNKFSKGGKTMNFKPIGFKPVGEDLFNYVLNPALKNTTFVNTPSYEKTYLNSNTALSNDVPSKNIDKSYVLRYAPVIGAAIGIGQNLFSKPNYSRADTLLEASKELGKINPVKYNPISNYLQYKPLDRNWYSNKLEATANANRRAISNSNSPARNAALLAADYNNIIGLGNLARQAEEHDLAQRQQVENFNRGTNSMNSEMALRTDMFNQEQSRNVKAASLTALANAINMKEQIDAARNASFNANLSNFFDSLGDIGNEAYTRNTIWSNPALSGYGITTSGEVQYAPAKKNARKKSNNNSRNV